MKTKNAVPFLFLSLAASFSALGQTHPTCRIEGTPGTGSNYTLTPGVIKITPNYNLVLNTVPGTPNGYRLTVFNIRNGFTLQKVFFPYDISEKILGASADDDVIFRPYRLGAATLSTSGGSGWWGDGLVTYSQNTFSPIVILADNTSARMFAAIDWPPRVSDTLRVDPTFMAKRLAIIYSGMSLTSGSVDFDALYYIGTGDSLAGDPPWLKAAARYRSWLKQKLHQSENWGPFNNQATWIRETNGLFNIQLQDIKDIDNNHLYIADDWYRRVLAWQWLREAPYHIDWIQFWGQMNRKNPDVPGTDCPGQPPPGCPAMLPQGCCNLEMDIHDRYAWGAPGSCGEYGLYPEEICDLCCALPYPDVDHCCLDLHQRRMPYGNTLDEYWDIVSFARAVAANGDHAGYYSRPHEKLINQTITETDDPLHYNIPNIDWWRTWMNAQGGPNDSDVGALDGWGASAYYLDTVAADYYEPLLDMARRLRSDGSDSYGGSPHFRNAVAEGAVDLYQIPFYVSGCLAQPIGWARGGPQYTLADLGRYDADNKLVTHVMVPEFGTFVLDDRVFFNGEGNAVGGNLQWGPLNSYWAERQAFILGHRFDIQTPFDDWGDCVPGDVPASGPPSPSLGCESTSVDQGLGDAIVARSSVDWRHRRLLYRDRQGITLGGFLADPPPPTPPAPAVAGHHVLARTFYDCAAGQILLVVDNWEGRDGYVQYRYPPSSPVAKCVNVASNERMRVIELQACKGDLNGDWVVNSTDLAILQSNRAANPLGRSPEEGDMNCDGVLDQTDEDDLSSRLGASCTQDTCS